VADALKREPGVDVRLEDGGKGEFTVLVDGRPVPRTGEAMPSAEDVLAVVRRAQPAGAA
jgi:hypothetical protein